MKKFYCPKHGAIDCVYVDGYHFGDRLLEGVDFKITLNDDGTYNAELEEALGRYFNEEKILKDCIEFVEQTDFGKCCVNGCHLDVGVDGDTVPEEDMEYLRSEGLI